MTCKEHDRASGSPREKGLNQAKCMSTDDGHLKKNLKHCRDLPNTFGMDLASKCRNLPLPCIKILRINKDLLLVCCAYCNV